MRTIAFDAEITKTGEISALSVVDESVSEILCMRPDRPSMLEAVAPILKDVFSSADVIIYYGADGNLSPFDITGIGQESNRVVDAMAEFSEARAVPDRCSGFKTYGIEEAAEFIGCEIKSIERGSSAAARTAFKAHAWASSRISSEPDPVRRYREDTWERNYEQYVLRTQV